MSWTLQEGTEVGQMPQVGDQAPAFKSPGLDNPAITLAQYSGQPVVLFFYPKDSTPGCTTEACDFRDNMSRVQAAGAVVLGVSRDSLKRHENFRKKNSLPFDLLSDESGEVTEAYGVWQEKKNYGKTYMGIVRSTFLIDSSGQIAACWSPVRVKGHVDAVMDALESL